MDDKYNELQPKYVKILTDSQAALHALNCIDFKSTIALEAAEALENLSWRTKTCRVAWIKAHAGTEGNEAADAAAKEGAERSISTNTLQTKIPYKTIRNNIEEAVYNEWTEVWQASPHYKHTKKFYSKPDISKAKTMLNLSRAELSQAISIITGFNMLSYIQSKADPHIDPSCRLCNEEAETFWHMITECPRLTGIRAEVFLDETPTTDNWKPNKLIAFSRYTTILNMLSHGQEYVEQPGCH